MLRGGPFLARENRSCRTDKRERLMKCFCLYHELFSSSGFLLSCKTIACLFWSISLTLSVIPPSYLSVQPSRPSFRPSVLQNKTANTPVTSTYQTQVRQETQKITCPRKWSSQGPADSPELSSPPGLTLSPPAPPSG